MTAEKFETWLEKVLPLIKEEAGRHGLERAVLVIDNASHHGRILERVSLNEE
jgi:hypothetical protein